MADRNSLILQSQTVRGEKAKGENTAERVGKLFEELSESAQVLGEVDQFTFASATALRAANVVNGASAVTHGFSSAGDGGAGTWRGVTDAGVGTYTNNGGTVIVPSGGDGSEAWLRLYSGPVSPEWFGATTDNSGDNTAAMLSAITAAGERGEVAVSGIVRCLSTISVAVNDLKISGPGKIVNDGTNKTAVEVSGDDVWLDGLAIEGNNTGEGSTSFGSGGHGIFFRDCARGAVSHCKFYNLGSDAADYNTSPIMGLRLDGLETSFCEFFDSCTCIRGADVFCGYACKKTRTIGCESNSRCDSFVALAEVSYTEGDTMRHVVANNIATRASGSSTGRHGVIVAYGAFPGRVSVTGNTFDGFLWTGVYVNAPQEPTVSLPPGALTVSGNTFWHIGGGSVEGLSAAIYITGAGGAAIGDNLIYRYGYDSDGTERATPVAAIVVRGRSRAFSIGENTIKGTAGTGILISNNQQGDIRNGSVSGNVIEECAIRAIAIEANDAAIDDVTVSKNTCVTSLESNGIVVTRTGTGTISGVNVDDNIIKNTSPGNTGIGMYWRSTNGDMLGTLKRNKVSGFATGMQTTNGYARSVPETLQVEGNRFADCAVGVELYLGAPGSIVTDSEFVNVTTPILYPNNHFNGRKLGVNSSGETLYEISVTAAPTVGAWKVGERADNTTKAVGQPTGWVCTAAPSTWTAEANL